MSSHKSKWENFIRAVACLDDAVQDYQQYHIESIRDGMIQHFEFSLELEWKAFKEYMTEQSVPICNSPNRFYRKHMRLGWSTIRQSGWKCCMHAIACRIFTTISWRRRLHSGLSRIFICAAVVGTLFWVLKQIFELSISKGNNASIFLLKKLTFGSAFLYHSIISMGWVRFSCWISSIFYVKWI